MEEVRRAYSVMAEQYIELFASSSHVHADDLALIARHLAIDSGVVLDVGCGPGHLAAHLRSMDVEAIGIDDVPEFIEHARTAYPDSPCELGSMYSLPVANQSVAGILAWYSLIHVPPDDLDGALAELRRVLIPGGTMVAGVFAGDEIRAFEHKITTAYYWPVDEFVARLRRAGFTEVERLQRSGVAVRGRRPHAAIAAVAT